ncbi:MAG TPA: PQQ-dependent sugar dehydrogenase, partial [Candidatus Limnocylindria bacterium]|nr:PQQ-dependent sugar dehydrogenase [Candidatus Limnocylindria bacterium]
MLSKNGQMYVITNLANPTLTPFMSLVGRVFAGSESGLIGLAFHPDYANPTNRYFFLFYSLNTNSPAGTALHQRISRFQTSASNPNQALTTTEVVLIQQRDPAGNHNGGDLHFGPDGYLYTSLGDGGTQYDGDRHSQMISSNFFSAIMRLDVDAPPRPGSLVPNPHAANTNAGSSTINYRIPADNPYIGFTSFDGRTIDPNRVRTEFYTVGFRNPWRFSFDPPPDFFIAATWARTRGEEVSIITKGGNYGWAYLEGLHPGYRPTNTVVGPLIPPIQEYRHGSAADQGNSITGGVVYRGNRLSQLNGWYVFADYVSGNIWRLRYDGTNTIPFQHIAQRNGISAFGIDPSNDDVLLASLPDGALYRLVYNTNTTIGTPLPPTLADTGAFTNLTSITNQTQTLPASGGIVAYDINV